MQTVHTTAEVGPDRVLHVAIPVERAGRHHVTIVYAPADETAPTSAWPPGYLEQVVGGWQGEFPEAPEGPFESRET